jgi:signal transduction histidine kinase
VVSFCRDCADKINLSGEFPSPVIFETEHEFLSLNTDSSFFKQIINNVIGNAVKFSPEGEEVHINLSVQRGNVIGLSVRDKGIGIPRHDLERILEPFFRSENALQYPGSGLGLTVAHKALEKLNGTLEIESTEGIGTTVNIWLPMVSAG